MTPFFLADLLLKLRRRTGLAKPYGGERVNPPSPPCTPQVELEPCMTLETWERSNHREENKIFVLEVGEAVLSSLPPPNFRQRWEGGEHLFQSHVQLYSLFARQSFSLIQPISAFCFFITHLRGGGRGAPRYTDHFSCHDFV